ncbi:hypothetical protein C4J81_13385 [Deltaproteobacteria bacterium Smac51]|nr:hypothetical protein C4J81_13385 [Deltaproteobacteria bacterium Smac51]
MRSILIDELLESEVIGVRDYLNRNAVASGIEDLYWIPLEESLWNETQTSAHHHEQEGVEAHSFRFAVELGPEWVRFEMLVRSEGLRNLGGGQADERQSMFLLGWADEMARQLNLFASQPAATNQA